MKKIMIIFLMLLTFNCHAIDIINLQMVVELGIIPGGHLKTYDFTRDIYKELSFYGDFNFQANMFNDHLYYGLGSKIYMWKVREGKSFKPDSINFLFFAGIRINENIEFFWKHYCDHAIKSFDNGSHTELERWYEEAGIKITFNLFNED